MCVCVCVCVRERERERESGHDGGWVREEEEGGEGLDGPVRSYCDKG